MKRRLILALVTSAAATLVQAGGPLSVCDNAPIKYSGAGSVTLNYDGGGALGSRTKAQADAIVNSAIALWNNVPTATVTMTHGADLPVDVTSSNYPNYLYFQNNPSNQSLFSDGKNPVVYDNDGSIIDALLGANQHQFVLGFAGSVYYLSPLCSYAEGQAVINGAYNEPDSNRVITVVAHELGHLIGMDHTQLDASQSLSTSNYPLMYPIAYRSSASLHEDDAAAVTGIYPESNYTATYGQVSGQFRNAGAAVRGANIWAQDVNNPARVYSAVSDYLQQGNGYFKLLLPPGTYTLHAEAIDSSFTGGSSVGPYSESAGDPSFQSPLYVSGQPMAPLTLGNGNPVRFAINAGCSATATFNFDGTGSVIGCARALSDFNADGRGDILWRNGSTGQVYRMLMNGLVITNGTLAWTEPDTGWKIVGDADFGGDGVADLLWRHDTTGQVSILTMNSSGLPGAAQQVYLEPNPAWKIVHTPDIDGDGKADILWWNSSTGQVYALLMDGFTVKAQGSVYAEPNVNWKIVAVGDFSGSGKRNQLLWRNGATGQVYLMTVTYSGGFSQTGQLIYTEPNLAWKIVGAADFNGDGRTDILWRNDSTGQVYMQFMNGGSITGGGLVYQDPNLAWKIVAQGDYNGDGKADLLWRNDSTGAVYLMLMNGLAVSSQGLIWQEPNPAWRILGPAAYAQ